MLANVNRGKNSPVAKSWKIYPLSIDDINGSISEGFTKEAADDIMKNIPKDLFKRRN